MRTYGHTDYLRLVGIFVTAGSVLVGSLVVVTLTSAGVSQLNTYFWATIATAALLSPNISLIPGCLGLVRDPETSTGVWVFFFNIGSVYHLLRPSHNELVALESRMASDRNILDTGHLRTISVRAHADGAQVNQHRPPYKAMLRTSFSCRKWWS